MELCAFTVAYLEALRAGDPLIEQHFVSYFSQLLVIKLRARRCSATEIDEIRQETFVRVLAALRQTDKIREPERFGAFVNSVCNNVFLEMQRALRRGGASLDEPDGAVDADRVASNVIDLDSLLVSEQSRRHVREVLRQLSPRDQSLLRAIFFDEKPKDDICREFSVDREYLRVLLHRAKQQFRRLYARSSEGNFSASPSR
jgi:RNA polymerase sigma-70 factor (ECF subfamily)